ncbi:MAG: sensor histidine kinase [Solirubrobacteraceae bacterium]
MSVSVKKTAPPAAALAGQQRGAMLKSLSRVLPSGLARRVLAAADADRQRIERDLHDGVQQRLTGLQIRLALAAESFQERGDKDASAALNGFGDEVEQAIEEVRAFARGVYPLLLASEGLGPALVSASRYAAAPITVSACGIRRSRPEVESAVYFTCLAAIDNAAKHAGPARVSVRAWDTAQALHFTVCDTGCGFDTNGTSSGAGLRNMHDRIGAVGGTLAVDSRPSHGTRLHGSVPDPWPGTAAGRRPPGYRALRQQISATSRHNPGTRHKATSAAAAKQHRYDQQAASREQRRDEPVTAVADVAATTPINPDAIAADGSKPSAQKRTNASGSLLLSPTRSPRAERARAH